MRHNRIAERRRAFLSRLVVGFPVIVHHVGIQRGGRFEFGNPPHRFAPGIVGDSAHFDQRRIGRRQGDADIGVGYIDPSLDGEVIFARPRQLIRFRPDDGPGRVHSHHAVGYVEVEGQVNRFLLVDFLLVDDVHHVHAVDAVNETDLARKLIATRRIGFDQKRCDQRPGFFYADFNRSVSLRIFRLSAGHIEIIVQSQTGLTVHELGVPLLPFETLNRTRRGVDIQPDRVIAQLRTFGRRFAGCGGVTRMEGKPPGGKRRDVLGKKDQLPCREPL